MKHNFRDLTGKIFNYLKVINFDKIQNGKTYWNCQCFFNDCGNCKSIRSDAIVPNKNGISKTVSCGCYANYIHGQYLKNEHEIIRNSMIGYEFNGCIITSVELNEDNNLGYANFICHCKEMGFARLNSIKMNHVKSCGCLHKYENGIAARNNVLNSYKQSARVANREWHLTDEIFFNLITQNCKYCGCEILNVKNVKSSTGSYTYNGIDSINNYIGYTLENVVPCCWNCNRTKCNSDILEFNNWIKRICNHKRQVIAFNNVEINNYVPEEYNKKYFKFKYEAIKRRDFSLTKEEWFHIINNPCFYCGISENDTNIKILGIDRVDNNQGYHFQNSVACCFMCNRAKYNLSLEEFYKYIDKLKLFYGIV